MYVKKSALWVLPLLLSGVSFASQPVSSYVATLSLGPAWSNAGETQTLFLTPGIQKTYAAKDASGAFTSGEFF